MEDMPDWLAWFLAFAAVFCNVVVGLWVRLLLDTVRKRRWDLAATGAVLTVLTAVAAAVMGWGAGAGLGWWS